MLKREYKLRNSVGKRQLCRRVVYAVSNTLNELKEQASSSLATCSNAVTSSINTVNSESIPHLINNIPEIDNFPIEHHSDTDSSNSVVPQNCWETHSLLANNNFNLKLELRNWATKHKIPHSAVTGLLKILSPIHTELPLDSRTLLQTPVSTVTKKLLNGEYWHCGITNFLNAFLLNYKNIPESTLEISFNIDGLPLFNSSNMQFWPILGLVKNFDCGPFVVGIFCGSSKPRPLALYLNDFVNELSNLLNNGFIFEQKTYFIKVHSFICDAPARAFIKQTKSHGGYSACDKCTEHGEYVNGRVIMQGISASKRTDESFLSQTDEDHHIGISPLLNLSVGLVTQVPIDYMHCVCLGVMRKLLHSWISGRPPIKLCSRSVQLISERLLLTKDSIPVEFNRKPRALAEIQRWKATEFRTFLLYLGPFVLKDLIDLAVYEHFLLLHCGITLLVSDKHISHFGYPTADAMLSAFVKHCKKIYGVEYYVYNIHVLLHLASDAEIYRTNLDNISTFPYENYLGQLKSMIRSPTKPLQQIHRRLAEAGLLFIAKPMNQDILPGQAHNLGPLPNDNIIYKQFQTLKYKDILFKINMHSKADCYCAFRDVVVQIHNILVNSENKVLILGKKFSSYDSLYLYPMDSKELSIYIMRHLSNEFDVWDITCMIAKCIVLPFQGYWMSLPIIHTLET